MISNVKNYNRQIIPRWNRYFFACMLGELAPLSIRTVPKIISKKAHQHKISDWTQNNKLFFALDLIGSSLLINDLDTKAVYEACDFVLKNKNKLPPIVIELAHLFLKNAEKIKQHSFPPNIFMPRLSIQQIYDKIKKFKSHVIKYPTDAITWLELGYYYNVLNQMDKASKCIDIAVSLGPDNRYILRSAARFYLHINKIDRSLYILRRSAALNYDPWLVSSEISIAEAFQLPAKTKKVGINIVNSNDFSPIHTSELAGTLGTLEINHGGIKKAKKLFKKALEMPTENTVAQAEWISTQHHENFIESPSSLATLFEANAIKLFREKNYLKTVEAIEKWFEYEPYRATPAIKGSYVASIALQDDYKAIQILEKAINNHRDNFTLKNNLAFSLASLNKLEEAINIITSIKKNQLNEPDKSILVATQGLLEFRGGRHDKGRLLYKSAIEFFKDVGDEQSQARALLIWAREEKIINEATSRAGY
jgi:tetratricopeptide (TPR) repeat protein